MREYVIAIDAMGGDRAPKAVINGAVLALRTYHDVRVLLVGAADIIKGFLNDAGDVLDRIEIVDAREVIGMDESPMLAVRHKTDSSMVRAAMTVREKRADAMLTAGSTGAMLACGMLRLGRIKGIERPALATFLPGKKNGFLLLDSGANVDSQPKYLMQFGLMGSVYMQAVHNIKAPKVGLANIGVEAEKGNKLVKEAYKLMSMQNEYEFSGNVEARDIPSGDFDVIVTDGFDGNILLKYTEGIISVIMSMLKRQMLSSKRSKFAALLLKPALRRFRQSMSYESIGGAPLLGVEGALIKAHGSSNAEAIKNAIGQARTMIEGDVVRKISEGIANCEAAAHAQ